MRRGRRVFCVRRADRGVRRCATTISYGPSRLATIRDARSPRRCSPVDVRSNREPTRSAISTANSQQHATAMRRMTDCAPYRPRRAAALVDCDDDAGLATDASGVFGVFGVFGEFIATV